MSYTHDFHGILFFV